MKKFLWFFFVFILCGFISYGAYTLFKPVILAKEGIIFYVSKGASKKVVLQQLTAEQLIPSSFWFTLYTYLQPQQNLKMGEYFFPKRSSAFSIWKQITRGTGFFQRSLTIVPGWTFQQLRQALLQAPRLQQSLIKLNQKQMMQALGYPDFACEGAFFPDTYFYTRGMSDEVILKNAIERMQKKLLFAWQQRATDLPYKNKETALIAASLIEKETALDEERPIIAGVLVNRLRQGMLLQFDPTVIYGMGEQYQGHMSKKDLALDTPYNTYIHKGLPPTPIAIPSMASIQAALHPAVHDYYYFVANGKGHQFSKHLADHERAVLTLRSIQQRPQSFFNKTLILVILQHILNSHFKNLEVASTNA